MYFKKYLNIIQYHHTSISPPPNYQSTNIPLRSDQQITYENKRHQLVPEPQKKCQKFYNWNIPLYRMLKTQILQKIDTCLKCYVHQNNTRYKRSIHTIFMDRNQLKNFYTDMQEQKQITKLDSVTKKSRKPNLRKSMSCFIKQNKVLDWKGVDSTDMNERPLISNSKEGKCRQFGVFHDKDNVGEGVKLKVNKQSGNWKFDYEMPMVQNLQFFTAPRLADKSQDFPLELTPVPPCPAPKSEQQQFDMQQIELIKKQQQQKYINRHRLKQGKKQLKLDKENKQYKLILDRNQLEHIKNQEKISRKLNQCFEKFVECVDLDVDVYREGNKEILGIRQQKKKKDQILAAMRDYFMRNNRNAQLGSKSKERKILMERQNQAKERIQRQLRSTFHKKAKNNLVI